MPEPPAAVPRAGWQEPMPSPGQVKPQAGLTPWLTLAGGVPQNHLNRSGETKSNH